MTIPRLIFLVGIPGSGKSTWLQQQSLDIYGRPFLVVNPDRIRKELYGDITDLTHHVEVWQEAKQQTINFLNLGGSVILDATNVQVSKRKLFLKDLPPCKLQAKIFPADPALCWERVKKDLQENKERSRVTEKAIYKYYDEYLYTKKVIESEGFEIISTL